MDGNIRLSATVISYIGKDEEKDDFYFNGNFSNCHNTESVQCSFDKACNNYVFAVSDSIGMDYEGETGISAIREIKKYHEHAKTQHFSLEGLTEKIYEAVQLSSNLMYSQSVISNLNTTALTGFSSVVIDNNRAILMNLGNNGAFLYRNGQQNDVFGGNDSNKIRKLKTLGISPNSTDIYNDTGKILKLAEEESKTKVRISSSFEIQEGDVLLLCSDGLLNAVGKSRIEAVINSGFDPSKMASILFQEAVKNFNGNGITIMVLRVDEIKNNMIDFASRRLNQVPFENEPEEEEESGNGKSIVNYILGFICIIVISGVLFMGYLIIESRDFLGSDRPATDTSQTSQTSLNTGAADASSTPSESSASASEASTSAQSADSSKKIAEPDMQSTKNGSKQNNDAKKDNIQKSNADSSKNSDIAKDNTQKSNTDSNKNSDKAKDNSKTETSSNQNENAEYDVHIVKSGDTLSSISSKYYGKPNNYDVIIKYNNLKNENSLYVNQELKIPKLKK